jgi:dihydrofolate reductase
MGKVIFGMVMSLDGFVNDRHGSLSRLYPDMEAMHEWPELQEAIEQTGAVILGRHSYDMARGDFTDYEFQTPIFVITHHPPATPAKGENDKLKFHFVTDGMESAIKQAKNAAGDKDVTMVGGVNVAQQAIKAGLIDEIHIEIRSILLGGGLHLFDGLDIDPVELEIISVSHIPGFIHTKFRVVK